MKLTGAENKTEQNRGGLIASMSVIVITLILLVGCGGKPFNVKPAPDLPPVSHTDRADYEGLAIEAAPVTDEDYLYDTFEANLILAGVLPVRVIMTNQGSEAIEMKKARFEVVAPGFRNQRAITGKKAFERVFSYYDITLYGQEGYKESRSDFISYAFDIESPLGAGQSRQGLMFFPATSEMINTPGLVLTVRRLKKKSDSSLTLKLN